MAQLLHEIIQTYKGKKPNSPEGRIVQRMTGIYEQLQQVFAESLHEGGENYREGGKENTANDGGVRYNVRQNLVDVNGNVYAKVIKPGYVAYNKTRRGKNAYREYLFSKIFPRKTTIHDGDGGTTVIEFARQGERVNDHPVLGEFTETVDDLKRIAILNFKELLQNSEAEPRKKQDRHQWLDEHGWNDRKAYMLDNSVIYPVILHIPTTRDGRHLLYDISVLKDKGVSLDTNATPHATPSVRTSENRETDSQQAVKKLTPSGDKVSQDLPGVKKNSVRYQVNQAAQEHLRQQNVGMGEDVADLNELVAAQRKRGSEMKGTALYAAAGHLMKTAGAKGMTFYFYRSWVNEQGVRVYTDKDGNIVEADNGFYDPSDGSIHIDLNSGDMGDAVLFTIAHELTHFIQDWSPSRYRTLCRILIDGYTEQGQGMDELVRNKQEEYRKKVKELTYEEAYDEVIASSMESVLNDGRVMDLLDEVETKDKGLVEQIRSFLEDVAQLLHEIIQTYKGKKPNSPEGRIVQRMTGIYEQLQQVFAEGLHEAGENYREGGKENTAQQGGVRYKASNIKRMTQAEIYAIQNIGRKSVNAFTSTDINATEKFARRYWQEMGVKSPFFRAWFGDWRVNDQTKVKVANQKGDTRGVQRNTDTGWDIQVSGQVFAESRHFAKKNTTAIPYLPYINDIVEKAVLLDSNGIEAGKAKSSNSLLIHSLYAVADIGNGPEVLKLYVEEMNDPNSVDTRKRAYQLQNIEKASTVNGGVQGNPPSSLANTVNAIRTVADLFAAVKRLDNSFNPNPVSKVINADGTPKVVYHGTSDQFTEFKHSELSDKEGSFFFAQNREDAEAYTGNGNVMAVYVNLQNPIDYNDMPSELYKLKDKKAQVTALRKLGYDGWMCDMDTGWGEVSAFEPNQIKSATDNIGTFDGSNPDIRYSVRYQVNQQAQQYLQEQNAGMGEDVADLNDLVAAQRRRGGGMKGTALYAAAGHLMKTAGAKGDKYELAKLLNEYYRYIGQSTALTWDSLRQQAQPVVDWLMEHTVRSKQISEYARDILDHLRGCRIYLDDIQKGEAAHLYGSFGAFRNMLMGTVTVANENSISLDSLWQELASLYPDVFDADMNAADMPEALLEAVHRLRNTDTSELEYEYNRDFIESELLSRVYDSYWNASTLYSVADHTPCEKQLMV